MFLPFCLLVVPGDAYSNDMELATMVSHLRVEAPKQLPRDDLVKDSAWGRSVARWTSVCVQRVWVTWAPERDRWIGGSVDPLKGPNHFWWHS